MRWALHSVVGAAILGAIGFSQSGAKAQTAGVAVEGNVEVLTSGPLHEAFAEPVALDAAATAVIKKKPPEPIEEMPPDTKPADDVVWIPGYWAWDDDRDDFIWVSGIWRKPAYGHRWVTGYWTEAADGYRRISGFWAPLTISEVSYVPDPPETLEQGPTTAAPSERHFWVPGCWMYREARYVWQPGYWAISQPDWLWIPHHYVWTPRGCVFVSGYWDYPFVSRGLPFCPVYFHRPIYRTAGYYFTPGVVINVAGLQLHLFARPRFHHYYFGDYYDDRYVDRGFYPWYAFDRWRGYDPFFAYLRVREGRDWEARVRDRYLWYRENERERPPRTYAQLRERITRPEGRATREAVLAASLRDAERELRLPTRLTRVAETERRELIQTAQAARQFERQRSQVERSARTVLRPGEGQRQPEAAPARLKLPEASRVARRTQGEDRDTARQPREGERPSQPTVKQPDQPATKQPDIPATRQPGVEAPRRPDRPARPVQPNRPTTPDVKTQATTTPDAKTPETKTPDRPARPDRPDRPREPRVERPGRPERPDQPARPQPPGRVERPDRPAAPEVKRPERPQPQPRTERAPPPKRESAPAPKRESAPAPKQEERPADRGERKKPDRDKD